MMECWFMRRNSELQGFVAFSKRARAGLYLCCFTMLGLVGTPSSAQETGSHIRTPEPAEVPSSTRISDDDKARIVLAAFALCVVQTSPKKSRAFISTFPGSAEEEAAGDALLTPDCLRASDLTLGRPLLRGAIYGALYKLQFKRIDPSIKDETPDYRAEAKGQPEAVANEYISFRQFAECTVRKDTPEVRALVLSPVAGKSEAQAAQEIIPDLGPCMVQGMSARMTKVQLYGLLAEMLYRLSVLPSDLSGETRGAHSNHGGVLM